MPSWGLAEWLTCSARVYLNAMSQYGQQLGLGHHFVNFGSIFCMAFKRLFSLLYSFLLSCFTSFEINYLASTVALCQIFTVCRVGLHKCKTVPAAGLDEPVVSGLWLLLERKHESTWIVVVGRHVFQNHPVLNQKDKRLPTFLFSVLDDSVWCACVCEHVCVHVYVCRHVLHPRV